jgi:hypothetical protein
VAVVAAKGESKKCRIRKPAGRSMGRRGVRARPLIMHDPCIEKKFHSLVRLSLLVASPAPISKSSYHKHGPKDQKYCNTADLSFGIINAWPGDTGYMSNIA